MCETENCQPWLDPLVRKIANNLGEDFDDVRYEVSVPGDSFFISSLFYVKIISNSNSENNDEKRTQKKKKKTVDVVLKKPPMLQEVREMTGSNEQFHNEILFYQNYAKGRDELPRCIYAEEKPPVDSVIVLENVVTRCGYEVCKWKFDVPLEYTLAAFREIGRFHANAYATKEQHGERFFEFVKSIQEARYYPGANMKLVINGTANRSVLHLRKQGYDKRFCDKVEDRLKNAYEDLLEKFIEPEEPLATLCHGDFTINNTLFKRENGGLKAFFIDFALIRYGSPVLDLSTFLCLHCARDIDENMLDNVLKAYHESLIQRLRENGVDCEKYPYEDLREDFKKKGLFGFLIATFFLAVSMGKAEVNLEDFGKFDPEEWASILCEVGGDEVSEILANMLLRLKEFGCLDYML